MSKTILMLAPHEPLRDPRVHWEAVTATEDYEVVVVGIEEKPVKYPQDQQYSGYRIVREPFGNSALLLTYCYRFWKKEVNGIVKLATIAVGIVFFPIMLVLEFIYKLLKMFVQQVFARMLTIKILRQLCHPCVTAIMSWGVIGRMRTRFRFFMDIQRHLPVVTEALLRGVEKANVTPNIVHCNDLNSLHAGVSLKKSLGCALVYDAHELWPVSMPNSPWYMVWVLKFYEKCLIRHADVVVTVSPQIASIMEKWYNLRDVKVVQNAQAIQSGTDTVEHEPDVEIDGGLRTKANGRLIFLFQGGYAPERGLEELIKAWRQIDGDKAILALRGVRWTYTEELEELAKDQIADGKIVFLPPVSEESLVATASKADVGLIPYRPVSLNNRYCCPNKLSQYMHAGLAVLANNLDYVKAIVEKHECGLTYDSNRLETLVSSIRRFIEDEAFLEQCKRNAVETGRNVLNWEIAWGPLKEAYRAHANNPGKQHEG